MEVCRFCHRLAHFEPTAVLKRRNFGARCGDFGGIDRCQDHARLGAALGQNAAPGVDHESGRKTYGHSLVVDPWGRVLAEGGTEPGVVFADIDPAEVSAARAKVPSLQHGRRFEILEPMAEPTHLHMVGGEA